MRTVDVEVNIQDGWEVQRWNVPDDAPNPITLDWFLENTEDCEMLDVNESGGLYEAVKVEERP